MSALSLFAVLAPLLLSRPADAQSVTAVCTYADWTHFRGQTPCQIWGKLQAACDSDATVPVLDTSANSDATYPPPTGSKATPCQCNVVAYNLMAGCSWCQPGVFSENWVSESTWRAGCSNYDGSGNLPSQATSLRSSIPPWAFLQENGDDWLSFQASSIAVKGTTPTIGGISATPTFSFSDSFDTFTDDGFGPSSTQFNGPTITGPFSGDDPNFDTGEVTNAVAKSVGIALGVVLGLYAILYIFILIIFCVRQKNRKAWYGPIAAFYANGGRLGDLSANQPLLGYPQGPNPFITPTPSATYPTSPYSATPPAPYPSATPPAPYPSTTPPASYPSTTPPVSGGYDPNQGHPSGQYQPQTGQYDSSLLYNGQQQPTTQQYTPPNDPSMSQHGAGLARNVPEL